MLKKNSSQLKVKIYGFDATTTDEATRMVAEKLSQIKVSFSGPHPLPTKGRLFTLPISPHKHKDAQEQFDREIHRRVIHIANPSTQDLEQLNKLKLPHTVKVKLVVES